MLATLERDLGDARQRLAVVFDVRRIADYKHLGVAGTRQVRPDDHPTGAVGLDAQPAARRRSRDTRRPQHGACRDALAGDDDAVGVDLLDGLPQSARPRPGCAACRPRPWPDSPRTSASARGPASTRMMLRLRGDRCCRYSVGNRWKMLAPARRPARSRSVRPRPARTSTAAARSRRILVLIGLFERADDAPPQELGVRQRLHARRQWRPLVVSEVAAAARRWPAPGSRRDQRIAPPSSCDQSPILVDAVTSAMRTSTLFWPRNIDRIGRRDRAGLEHARSRPGRAVAGTGGSSSCRPA